MARGRKDVSDVIRGRHVWSATFRYRISAGSEQQETFELISTAVKDCAVAVARTNRFFKRNRRFKDSEIVAITYHGQLRA